MNKERKTECEKVCEKENRRLIPDVIFGKKSGSYKENRRGTSCKSSLVPTPKEFLQP